MRFLRLIVRFAKRLYTLYAVFTSPQVAGVGIKESEYMAKFGTCLCSMVKLGRIPKAKAISETKGLIFMALDH